MNILRNLNNFEVIPKYKEAFFCEMYPFRTTRSGGIILITERKVAFLLLSV